MGDGGPGTGDGKWKTGVSLRGFSFFKCFVRSTGVGGCGGRGLSPSGRCCKRWPPERHLPTSPVVTGLADISPHAI